MADGTALAAFWLPGLDARQLEFEERPFGLGKIQLRIPTLTPEELREVLLKLRQRRTRVLADRPIAGILESIEAAARRLTRTDDALHAQLVETLPGLTGYSEQMIEMGLRRMGSAWTAEALRAALCEEFGDLEVLNKFQPRKSGGFTRAVGPSLTVHFFSGNIPGVSVSSLIRALCVKSASFGKTASGEPYLAVCFARALAEEDAELAECLAVSYWPGGDDEREDVAFAEADAVVAYGNDETLFQIRRRVPAGVRMLEYPNRVGAALVTKSALTPERAPELARLAAQDVAAFDQQGCVSPHLIYVQRGGGVTPLEFAEVLAVQLDRLSVEIPRGRLSPADSSLIHQLRAQAEVRGATVLASEGGTEWTVIVEERTAFDPSPLHRVIQIRPVDDPDVAVAALQALGRRLQTVAVAGEPDEMTVLAGRLAQVGATRIVPLGETAWPSPHWHHDGRFQFLDLVRFVDLEVDE